MSPFAEPGVRSDVPANVPGARSHTSFRLRHSAEAVGLTILRYQFLLTGTALLISSVQWFLAGHPSWWSTLIYTLASGNAVAVLMASLLPLYQAPFPANWVRYLVLLFPSSILASVVGGIVNRLALRLPLSSLLEWHRGDLPYATLISFAMGLVIYAFASTRMQMEAEKQALAQQVQLGQAALETHAADLRAAFEIQASLLPKTIPSIPGVEISCAWEPARTVSGDYFHVLELAPDKIGFCLADVSGKGMSAALVTANLHAAFRAFALGEASPARVCERLNEAFCDNLPTGKFVALVYGILDRQRMQLTYEIAGHNPPLLLRNGNFERLQGSGPVLGMLPNSSFTDHVIALAPNDYLLLATDGITEAVPPGSEDEFGEERLALAALQAPARNAHSVRAEVMRQVSTFAMGQFFDDASLMVIAVTRAQ